MNSSVRGARIFAVAASLLVATGASAAPPKAAPAPQPPPPLTPAPEEPAPDATPIDPYEQGAPPADSSTVTKLPKPVPSPLHPRLRGLPATTMGAGVYCPNFGSRSQPYGSYCTGQIRMSSDSRFGDVHVALLLGDVLKVGAMLGFEMGTPYIQLGGKRSRLAMALRGSFDLVAVRLGKPIPGQADDGLLSFSNTYGPHMSIALSPSTALEIRGAVGWAVGGFWDNQDGFGKPVYAFVAEGWIGLRMGR